MKRLRKPHVISSLIISMGLTCLSPVQAQINLPVLGDSLSGTISTQQEYEFGREFLRSIRRETQTLNDPLMEAYISSLTFKLATNSELTDHRLAFILIDSEQLNAFAAPGGIIGVNAGLFLYTKTEGQFASVLAHELAHISQRHYARQVEQSRNSRIPNMAGLLASLIIMGTAGGEAGQAAMMANQAISRDNVLRFGRSHEQEADRIGIRTLYSSGFDPYDMAGMFQQMLASRGSAERAPEFLSTHPLDENRISDTMNRAHNLPPVNHQQNSEFLLMRERALIKYSPNLKSELDTRTRELPHTEGTEGDAMRYGLALAQMLNKQYPAAEATLSVLLAKEPERISYVMMAADIALAAGDNTKAIAIIEHNLQINPDNHALSMTYATALNRAKRHKEAAAVLEKHAQLYPNDMQLWFDLAEIQGQAGNIIGVHMARAEYFITVGDFTRARDQLSYALGLEKDRLAIARIRQRQEYIREIQNKFYR